MVPASPVPRSHRPPDVLADARCSDFDNQASRHAFDRNDSAAVLSAAHHACAVAAADACLVLRLDPDGATVLVSLLDGQDTGDAGRHLPPTQTSSISTVILEGEPQVIHDVAEHQPHPAPACARDSLSDMRSAVHLPLAAAGHVLGVMSLYTRLPAGFPEPERLRPIAYLAASALENARLHGELREQEDAAARLDSLARSLAARPDPADYAALITEHLRGLLRFDYAAILLADDDGLLTAISMEPPCRVELPIGFQVGMPLARYATTDAGPARALEIGPADLGTDFRVRWPHFRAGLMTRLDGPRGCLGLVVLGCTQSCAYSSRHRALLGRAGSLLSASLAAERRHEALRRLHIDNLRALGSALRAGDDYALGHGARVAAYLTLLGRELGWEPHLLSQAEECAHLHDIGMIAVPEHILRSPAPLAPRDKDLVRRHPAVAADALTGILDDDLVAAVRHHHERYDGTGYPARLRGHTIPLVARAMAVADAYDAISHPRAHRAARGAAACREEVHRCSGTQFDPEMVTAFLRALEGLDHLRRAAAHTARDAAAEIANDATLANRQSIDHPPDDAGTAPLLADVLKRHPSVHRLSLIATLAGETVLLTQAGTDVSTPTPSGRDRSLDLGVLAGHLRTSRDHEQAIVRADAAGTWLTAVATMDPVADHPGTLILADVRIGTGLRAPSSDPGAPSFSSLLHTTARELGRARLYAITDPLTGLYNQRYLHVRLAEELERAREAAGPLSLLFIDIDRFKDFNDTYGHSVGDAALRTVASVLTSTLRRIDLAARYGGEEFVVALIDTDIHGAVEVAERVRRAISHAHIGNGVRHLSASIGVATFPDDARHREDLIDKADWAMYAAKRSGRDSVRSFSTGQLRFDLAT